MLQLFRAKKEWLKWVLILVIIGLGFTTVLLFVRTPSGIMGGVGVQEVAKVAGQPITASQFRRHYQQLIELYRQMYNLDKQDPKILQQLGVGQQALNQIINQYAVAEEARVMGLTVTNEEVIGEISRLPVFQENGQFIGAQRYRQILQVNNLTAQEFEAGIRRDILSEKFRNVLTDGIAATEDEVRERFLESNQEAKVSYVVFDPKQIAVEEAPEESLRAYFKEHQDDFRSSEQRKIKYVVIYINPDEVQVNDEQIQREMGSVSTEEQVRAQHILLDLTEGEEAARQQATKIRSQIRSGGDFAALARFYSADGTSALRGGDLGFFPRGRMVPEFETVAFSLKPGEVSDLVRTPFGYHILKVLAKTKPGQDSQRPVAEFNARLKEAEKRAASVAQEIIQGTAGGVSFDEEVQKHGLQVQESPYFDNTSGIPGLAVGDDFLQQVFSLSVGGITKPYVMEGVDVVARLEDLKPARIPEFDEIRSDVAEQYKQQQGEALAEEKAKEFVEEAQQADSFPALAKKHGLRLTTTGLFKKGMNIDDNLRFSPVVHEQAFALGVGEVSTPVLVADNYVVFQVVERTALDEEKFQQEKPKLLEQLTEQRRSEFYSAYLQNVVAELRRKQEIVINQKLLDDITRL